MISQCWVLFDYPLSFLLPGDFRSKGLFGLHYSTWYKLSKLENDRQRRKYEAAQATNSGSSSARIMPPLHQLRPLFMKPTWLVVGGKGLQWENGKTQWPSARASLKARTVFSQKIKFLAISSMWGEYWLHTGTWTWAFCSDQDSLRNTFFHKSGLQDTYIPVAKGFAFISIFNVDFWNPLASSWDRQLRKLTSVFPQIWNTELAFN